MTLDHPQDRKESILDSGQVGLITFLKFYAPTLSITHPNNKFVKKKYTTKDLFDINGFTK